MCSRILNTCGFSEARAISGRIAQNTKRFANDRRTIFVGDMGKLTNLLVRHPMRVRRSAMGKGHGRVSSFNCTVKANCRGC